MRPVRTPSVLATPAILTAAVVLATAATLRPATGTAEGRRAVAPPGDGIRLVVLVTVDQLTPMLLERYDPVFTGGLRRLLDGGRVYPRAVQDHAATATAPGHANLATGTFPRRHGIVGNAWYERGPEGIRRVNNNLDPETSTVGVPEEPGRSPRKLLRSGFADWLRDAHPGARIVSLSRKPRGAILPAGRVPDAAVYWYSSRAGRFVTSTYYRDEDPGWVREFHAATLPGILADSVWEVDVPPEWRGLARADSTPYEARGRDVAFPHRFGESGEDTSHEWLLDTPFLDRAVVAMGRAAVDALELGRRAVPDLLALGLSQTDAVGHVYGPLSLEQLDNLFRLDRDLGELFAHLDRTVGRDRYVVALSADHGVMPMPEQLRAAGVDAGRLTRTRRDSLAAVARAAADAARGDGTRRPGETAGAVAAALRRVPWVVDAASLEELLTGAPTDSFRVFWQRAQRPDRFDPLLPEWQVEVRLPEYWLPSAYAGTTHGSPYHHDRWIPFILWGPGIRAGRDERRVRAVDLAPTLAAYLGVAAPPDLDGVSALP